jgi:solute carrier family 25 oxoglutarate transporter 11
MQLLGENPSAKGASQIGIAKQIFATEGVSGLYRGLSAALVRQATYTTLRLGTYDVIKELICKDGKESFLQRVISASGAGAIGSFLSCPVEVCLVRMQADGRLPLNQQRGYKNVVDALIRVAREEGVLTYWRGATPTVTRAIVVSVTQLATYDQFKTILKSSFGMADGIPLHFNASLGSGFVYSLISLPIDTAKTRMQTQTAVNGQLQYKSTIQTMGYIAKNEGVASLWKGFGAYFTRSGGHTIFMFLFLEQYRSLVTKFYS